MHVDCEWIHRAAVEALMHQRQLFTLKALGWPSLSRIQMLHKAQHAKQIYVQTFVLLEMCISV